MTKDDFGGGILITAPIGVILHHCTFDKCYSNRHGAGGAISGGGLNFEGENPNLDNAKKLDIQYTCFSNCYQTQNNDGFGSALIMAAQDVIFFYASTVNCPGPDKKSKGE